MWVPASIHSRVLPLLSVEPERVAASREVLGSDFNTEGLPTSTQVEGRFVKEFVLWKINLR